MTLQRRNVLLSAGALLSLPSWAQSYPSQPIKLIMPFAPGTASEAALRILLESYGFNQPVQV